MNGKLNKQTVNSRIIGQSDILESLFNQLDDAVFIKDLDGKYLTINPKGAELIGQPIEKIIGFDDTAFFSPEEAKALMAQDLKVIQSGHRESVEEHLTFDGKEYVLWSTKIPMRDDDGKVCGLIGVAKDITESSLQLRQYNEELLESEERLRNLFEGIDDAVIVHDASGRILDCNQAACTRMGYTKSEFLNLSTNDIDAPDFAEGFRARFSQQSQTGRLRVEGRHLTKDGREISVDIVTSLIDFHGDKAVLAVVRDISDLKKAEQDRRSLELQIQHAQKLESLGVLAGGIAHDFNNLLMGILGNADLALLQLPQESKCIPEITGIQTSAKRAAELCQQLLAYSGKGHFIIQPTSINELISEMGKLLEITISKKVKISYILKEALPTVEADITQLRQVIMNLITNSSDAIGDNPGEIVVRTDYAEFSTSDLEEFGSNTSLAQGKYVVFEITDSGCGMDIAVKDRIFEPFFSTKDQGKGLGLSAVLGIIRGHRGAIKVDSKKGEGTVMTLLFPPSVLPATSLEFQQTTGTWRGSGIVLLADDEELVRNVASKMLESIGFSVITATDGKDALEKFHAHRNEIKYILLDISMPHLSGQETLKEIRRLNSSIPVILSSGYNPQKSPIELHSNAPGFIQKPYQLEKLRSKFQEMSSEE